MKFRGRTILRVSLLLYYMVLMARVNKSMQIVLVMIAGDMPPLHVEVVKTGSYGQ